MLYASVVAHALCHIHSKSISTPYKHLAVLHGALKLSLPMQNTHVYLDAARDCYEAFVIYNFFMYLLAYLEDEYGDIDAYFSTKEDIPHLWPVNYCLNAWPMGISFFCECKKGIINYVILRPLMTMVSLISNAVDSREAGNRGLDFRHPYIYTTIINNFSQTWALYCLVLMFKATKDELSPIRPFSKFIIVKAVVFFSFWQSVGIQLIAWWKPEIFGGDVSLVTFISALRRTACIHSCKMQSPLRYTAVACTCSCSMHLRL